jgi:hypothetical protein
MHGTETEEAFLDVRGSDGQNGCRADKTCLRKQKKMGMW